MGVVADLSFNGNEIIKPVTPDSTKNMDTIHIRLHCEGKVMLEDDLKINRESDTEIELTLEDYISITIINEDGELNYVESIRNTPKVPTINGLKRLDAIMYILKPLICALGVTSYTLTDMASFACGVEKVDSKILRIYQRKPVSIYIKHGFGISKAAENFISEKIKLLQNFSMKTIYELLEVAALMGVISVEKHKQELELAKQGSTAGKLLAEFLAELYATDCAQFVSVHDMLIKSDVMNIRILENAIYEVYASLDNDQICDNECDPLPKN